MRNAVSVAKLVALTVACLGCGESFTGASSSDDSGTDDRSATVMGTGGVAGAAGQDAVGAGGNSSTMGVGGATGGGTATGGSSGTGGAANEDASHGGAGGAMDAASSDQTAPADTRADAKDAAVERRTGGLLLPFAVDAVYVPSGYAGDGALLRVTTTDASGNTTCDRAPGATNGMCHVFTYRYQHAADSYGWAGVTWQSPANNWGTQPGPVIAEGAKRVAFSARSAGAAVAVHFLVGGIMVANSPYQDTIRQEIRVNVLPTWQEFSIDLSASTYVNVLGGFNWTVAVLDNGIDPAAANVAATYTIYLDNIRWE
jgi:hypothetical protein